MTTHPCLPGTERFPGTGTFSLLNLEEAQASQDELVILPEIPLLVGFLYYEFQQSSFVDKHGSQP